MKKTIIFLLVLSLFSSPYRLKAQTESNIKLKVLEDSFSDESYLYVDILLESSIDSFNAVQNTLSFEMEHLNLVSIDYTGSFCNILAIEKIENELGYATIVCGNEKNNQSEEELIAHLKFEKKDKDWTKLGFTEALIVSTNFSGTYEIAIKQETHNIFLN